jgi:hypothetical protein
VKHKLRFRSNVVEVDQALEIIRSEPLAGKVAGMIRDMSAAISAETGAEPVCMKVGIQMPDDSVYEARVEWCPDGCGQVMVIPAVVPRL